MEIAADALKFETQKGKLHAEINLLGIAYTGDGGVAARFSDALKFRFRYAGPDRQVEGKAAVLREGV